MQQLANDFRRRMPEEQCLIWSVDWVVVVVISGAVKLEIGAGREKEERERF